MAQGDYNRLTQVQFLERAAAAHGTKYNYSFSFYAGKASKVKIGCPVHGLFEQLAGSHMKGLGCRKCGQALTGRKLSITQAQFIEKCRERHGSMYGYSKVLYKGSKAKITITCPEHGDFRQTPLNHVYGGNGCPKCGALATGNTFLKGREHFLNKFRTNHGNKFNYDKLPTDLKGGSIVEIGCPKHGYFRQKVSEHAQGYGCKQCAADARKELNKLSWADQAKGKTAILYLIKLTSQGEEFYKIGVTCQSVKMRYKSLADLNGYQYEILAQHTSKDAARIYDWEQSILETFAHLRYYPKRPFGGETECFSEADPILAIFPL